MCGILLPCDASFVAMLHNVTVFWCMFQYLMWIYTASRTLACDFSTVQMMTHRILLFPKCLQCVSLFLPCSHIFGPWLCPCVSHIFLLFFTNFSQHIFPIFSQHTFPYAFPYVFPYVFPMLNQSFRASPALVGEKQAEELAQELLRSVDGFAVVGSSEQRRAMGSAELVAQRFPAARRVRVKELHEMKYGDLETGQNFWKSDRLLCGI